MSCSLPTVLFAFFVVGASASIFGSSPHYILEGESMVKEKMDKRTVNNYSLGLCEMITELCKFKF